MNCNFIVTWERLRLNFISCVLATHKFQFRICAIHRPGHPQEQIIQRMAPLTQEKILIYNKIPVLCCTYTHTQHWLLSHQISFFNVLLNVSPFFIVYLFINTQKCVASLILKKKKIIYLFITEAFFHFISFHFFRQDSHKLLWRYTWDSGQLTKKFHSWFFVVLFLYMYMRGHPLS